MHTSRLVHSCMCDAFRRFLPEASCQNFTSFCAYFHSDSSGSLIRGEINREEVFVNDALIEALFKYFFAEVVTKFL